jgi:hypothetical protein
MISAFSLFLAAAAVAQPAAPVATAAPAAKKDLDPVICERMKEVGSLLNSKKICKRRSEWAEDRRSDRANIERSQRSGMNAP